jgi:hypothetical protein
VALIVPNAQTAAASKINFCKARRIVVMLKLLSCCEIDANIMGKTVMGFESILTVLPFIGR